MAPVFPHELDGEDHGLFDYEHTAATSSSAASSAGADPQLFGSSSSSSNVDPTETIIDTEKQPASYEYEDPNDSQRTVAMTVFFLVLMVLYMGFCCYYRKVKTRRTVGDTGEETLARQQRRSENRAVMDESMTASSRARQSDEEAKKLDERKDNIKRALLSRLIVDETEQQEGERKKKIYSDGDENVACEGENKNCSCQGCQYWHWENAEEGKTQKQPQEGTAAVLDEVELTAATNAAAFAIAGSNQRGAIISIQEDSDEDEEEENQDQPSDVEEADIAKAQDEKIDIEAQTLDSNENKVPLSSPISSPLPSPSSSPRSSPRALQPASPPTTPSRLSLSLDALNCGNRKSPMDALNCGSTSSRLLNCSNHAITCNMNAGKHKSNNSTNNNDNKKSTVSTISLSAVIGTYGEECNICLSQFQVGDRAAWSKPQSVMGCDDPAATIAVAAAQDEKEISDCLNNGSDHSNNVQGCRHIFHEECISRWLLVRDGCPICRRTYFPEGVIDECGTDAAVPDVDEGRDLEVGMVR